MATGTGAATRLGLNRTSISFFLFTWSKCTLCCVNCFTHFHRISVLVGSGNHVILQYFTFTANLLVQSPALFVSLLTPYEFWALCSSSEVTNALFFLTWLPCLQHFFPPLVPIVFCSAIIHRRGCRQQTSGKIYADWALKTLLMNHFPPARKFAVVDPHRW